MAEKNEVQQRIERARQLLGAVRHAAMATVNEDGSPHNTPYFFMYDEKFENLYWGSHPDSQHSQNVKRTKQIFVVVYDAVERGGLYVQANEAYQVTAKELPEALRVHNFFRATEGKEPLPESQFKGKNPQRMYKANVTNLWVTLAERGKDGQMIRDIRIPISHQDLLGGNI
ncbi:MAG: pyridoxamine 5'-phosphate oxidase family protein [Candidatus Saccharimonadales bacterium]